MVPAPWSTRRKPPGAATRQSRRMSIDQVSERLAAIVKGMERSETRVSEQMAADITVAELAERYMKLHVAVNCKPRTALTIRGALRNHILPVLGQANIGAVGPANAAALQYGLRDKPDMANKAIGVLSQMYRLAEAWELMPPRSNPCRLVRMYPARARERFLKRDEYRRLGRVLAEADAEGTGATATATISTDVTTLGTISTYLNEWNEIVKAAAKHLSDGTTNEVSNLPELQESLRRVTAVRDHVQAEQRRLVNVLRAKNYEYDHDTDGATDEVTVSNVLRAYDTELAKRKSAADSVRSSVTALENARNALHAAMRDPGTFLGQVVDRRQYEKDQADANVAEFDAGDAPESVTKAAENAAMALMAAQDDLDAHTALVGDEDNPASALLQALLEDPALPNGKPNPADDDGQALIDAISTTYETASAAHDEAHEAYEKAEAVEESVMGLTGEGRAVATNTANITDLDGRVTANEETLVDHGMKLMQKKEYIDNLAAEIGIDPVTGEGTMEGGMSRIDYNAMGIMGNAENIAANAGNIMTNSTNIMENRGMIEMNSGSIAMNSAGISSNADAIASNMNSIGQNSSAISDNRNMIGELSEDLDVVRAGVAASMALAGMPAINGRGISIGVGSFDGESAFAVGFQIQGEMASFKVGVTSASGATGASAGVGFQF